MTRTTTMLASALSLIAISIAVKQTRFPPAAQTAPYKSVKTVDASRSTPVTGVADNSRTTPSPEISVRERPYFQDSGTSSLSSGVDRSVIGIPFPVSASVEAYCINKAPLHCEREHQALAKMAQQPRDEAWAAKTESQIQDEVISQGPGIYSIRNIECRSSICAVEVKSLSRAYIGANYNFLAVNGLFDDLNMFASPENDELGRRTQVTLVIFFKSFYQNPSPIPGLPN